MSAGDADEANEVLEEREMRHTDFTINRRLFLTGVVSAATLAVTGCGFTGESELSPEEEGRSAEWSPRINRLYFSGAQSIPDPHFVITR